MGVEQLAINLRRLRRAAGLTQKQVAEKAALSLSGYRKLERGDSEQPRSGSLKAIASVLEVSVADLFTQVEPLQKVRFRSLKRLKSREQVLAEVTGWLNDFVDLEVATGEQQPHELESLWRKYREQGPGRIPEFARLVRDAFGLGEKEPVHDICGLLEARGIKVRSTSVNTDAFMGLSVGAEENGGPAVVVNTWSRLPVETWIFSAAHELGHLLMHLGAYDVHLEEEDLAQEKEADCFASHFLMPEPAFQREWSETAGLSLVDRVFKVKRVFRVSWRTVLYRVAGHLESSQRSALWVRFNRAYRQQNGRSLLKHDEPAGIDAEVYHAVYGERPIGAEPHGLDAYDFKEDRLPWLVRKGLESEVITLSRAAEILGLPYSQMRALSASWVA